MDLTSIWEGVRWFFIGWSDHVMNWWAYVGGPVAVILGAALGWGLHDIWCSWKKLYKE